MNADTTATIVGLTPRGVKHLLPLATIASESVGLGRPALQIYESSLWGSMWLNRAFLMRTSFLRNAISRCNRSFSAFSRTQKTWLFSAQSRVPTLVLEGCSNRARYCSRFLTGIHSVRSVSMLTGPPTPPSNIDPEP